MAKVTQLKIELEQEEDGRWIGEVPSLPGVMAYGQTRTAALAAVQALALRATADRLEDNEAKLPCLGQEQMLTILPCAHLVFAPSSQRLVFSPSRFSSKAASRNLRRPASAIRSRPASIPPYRRRNNESCSGLILPWPTWLRTGSNPIITRTSCCPTKPFSAHAGVAQILRSSGGVGGRQGDELCRSPANAHL